MIKIRKLEFLDVFSGPDFYLKLPNGDDIYSITAFYLTSEAKGNIEIDKSESIDLHYFHINDLPEGLDEADYKYIEAYLKNR
ncbi:hypothetical protein [Bacillus sp. SM2101]|uniref:hypothetical protein n=1 Tax=Bacillus sp. SM2101 TaxID=2805366 RepID=UPI001BDF2EB6|nr:hypothetical protein [Bacillus sp. SM2101]